MIIFRLPMLSLSQATESCKVILVKLSSQVEEAFDVGSVLRQARKLLLRKKRMETPHDRLDVLNDKVSDKTRAQSVRTAVLDARPTRDALWRKQAFNLRHAGHERPQTVRDDWRRANFKRRNVNREQ